MDKKTTKNATYSRRKRENIDAGAPKPKTKKIIDSDYIDKMMEKISKKENVKILYCCELGYKGWIGNTSTDSTYSRELYFVYYTDITEYLGIKKTKDMLAYNISQSNIKCYGININKFFTDLFDGNVIAWSILNARNVLINTGKFEYIRNELRSNDYINYAKVIDNAANELYDVINTIYNDSAKNNEVSNIHYFNAFKYISIIEHIYNNLTPFPINLSAYVKKLIRTHENKVIVSLANDIAEGKCGMNDVRSSNRIVREFIVNKHTSSKTKYEFVKNKCLKDDEYIDKYNKLIYKFFLGDDE